MPAYEELHITLPDGYDAYARYWSSDRPIGAVLHIHGIQSHCGWYTETARALNAAGFAVLQPDRRGSGHNDRDRGHADSAQQLIDDGLACAGRLAQLSGIAKLHLIGVSWGGKLVAAMHTSDPGVAASLSLVAPGIHPIVDVSATEKFKIGWSMVSNPTKHYDIPLNDPELFTDKPEWIEFLKSDDKQIHQATAGFFLASRRMDKIVARLPQSPAVPIRVFLARHERIIDNDKTRAFVDSLPWPARQVTQYDRSRHTLEFGDDRDRYIADLTSWLKDPPPRANAASD